MRHATPRRRPVPGAGPVLLAVAVAALLAGGCRQDMHDQPKYESYEASRFFADGTSARPVPRGTVARGQLRDDEPFYSGFTEEDELVGTIPIRVTADVLERGRFTYDAFCAPCHDRAGTGLGMVVRRGFKQPPTYHQERLREAPPGHFFDVMTNGFGQMPSYADQIEPADRWAVVAYIRALQLSQHARLAELPPEDRERALEAGVLPEITDATRQPGAGADGPADGRGVPRGQRPPGNGDGDPAREQGEH
ncbi:MAG: c-type cytochrome [Thermoanaerobaculia bacterium]